MYFQIDNGSKVRVIKVNSAAAYAELEAAAKDGHKVSPCDQPKGGAALATGSGTTDRAHNVTRAGAVSETAVARIEQTDQWLKNAGFEPAETVYALGSTVVPLGLDNYNASRAAWEVSAPIEAACRDVAAVIKAETRVDRVVAAKDIRMGVQDGSLMLINSAKPGPGLRVERHGLFSLAARMPGLLPHKGFVATMHAAEIAELWNSRVGRMAGDEHVKVRARKLRADGAWSTYAAVSPKYGAHNGDLVLQNLAQALEGSGLRGSVIYDQSSTAVVVDGQYHAPKSIQDLAAGDTFKVGIRAKTADNGTAGLSVAATMLRNLCLNLIILDDQDRKLFRRVHRGNMHGVSYKVRRAAKQAAELWAPFAEQWGILAKTDAGKIFKGETLAAHIANLVDRDGKLRDAASGITRDALVEALLQNAAHETDTSGPGSLADIVNAVTRMHSLEKVPAAVTSQLESYAGTMVSRLATQAQRA